MRNWIERPREEAYLFNPAFCCTLLTAACAGYQEAPGRNLPFPVAFMVLPIVLHKQTRQSLPPTTRSSFPAWIQDNASLKIQFQERLVSLKPHTREAILLGISTGWLELIGQGDLSAPNGPSAANRTVRMLKEEAKECVQRAKFLGKWFASAGSTETTMALWGIRP